MRRTSIAIAIGLLTVAGLALCAEPALAQHHHHDHHHHHHSYGNIYNSPYVRSHYYYTPQYSYSYPQAYSYGAYDPYASGGYSYTQPYYAAPYQNYYVQPQTFSFGFQNRDFGIYLNR